MPSIAVFGKAVKKPACPIMDVSMSALQGQTVTQWPHDTQLDSPIVVPPSHNTRG
jgi:FixJ family two-component response regulator